MYSSDFQQFVWEQELQVLELKHFNLGINITKPFVIYTLLSNLFLYFFQHLLFLALEVEFPSLCFSVKKSFSNILCELSKRDPPLGPNCLF